ncbi:hypothetical protein Tsubulata_027081 [Turnera subulata]|uniref:2-(3-amino-3-carboxypropyl)histidine synthase subunit 2 n=1 Tax=Turnera subulata TaxID=218843 RepID=A0A9Q0G4Y8_9ROSI|nr:hypothetical protein Tsubulata_027081 [Turnera subulata]
MELEEIYEINRTVDFILSRNFTRVALQFPDELLKDSIRVVRALRNKLQNGEIGLFVMADTAYGSCCVDEVGASHIDAHCVVHYGHSCLSPTSTIPALCVFGKELIDTSACAKSLLDYTEANEKRVLVLFGLEYAHAMQQIREELTAAASTLPESKDVSEFHFAEVMCSVINPSSSPGNSHGPGTDSTASDNIASMSGSRHGIGGLTWDLPSGQKVEDYLLFWIGSDGSAFENVVLTFNGCKIVRYDAKDNYLVTDLSQQRRILKRRYFLVEKAKDANIVGILVGTLGVAGYLNMIQQMKDLITGAGKKVYTFVMGRPNPAKLANFPECNVFIYVSCAQTALLDSKQFYAPVITPFEALLAFNRGSQWTGAYVMEFQHLINSSPVEERNHSEEARFSFMQGGYVEDLDSQEKIEKDDDGVLALANITEKALQLQDKNSTSLIKGTIKSGADYYLSTRTYHGLEIGNDNAVPEPYVIGRTGKASGYEHERS